MKVYNSFTVWYRGDTFMNVLANDQKDVEQFILDWCVGNNTQPTADEWLIKPVDSIISKESMNEIMGDSGGSGNILGQVGSAAAKGQAVPGLLKVKINPKCWG